MSELSNSILDMSIEIIENNVSEPIQIACSTEGSPAHIINILNDLYYDPIMEDIQVSIVDTISQVQWMILEEVNYEIQTTLKGSTIYNVRRRYKDFEWLFQEISFRYVGYILPPLPEKRIIAKVDSKLTYFHEMKKEFMEIRQEMLLQFLKDLCQHSHLRYCQELKSFLIISDSEFIEIQQQRTSNLCFGINLIEKVQLIGYQLFGFQLSNQFSNKLSEELLDKKTSYESELIRLTKIIDSFAQILQIRKQRAVNYQCMASIFESLSKLTFSILHLRIQFFLIKEEDVNNSFNLEGLTFNTGEMAFRQINQLQKLIGVPLQSCKGLIINCLTILKNLNALTQDIDANSMKKSSSDSLDTIQNSYLKKDQSKITEKESLFVRMKETFINDEKKMHILLQSRMENIKQQLNSIEEFHSTQLLHLWVNQDQLNHEQLFSKEKHGSIHENLSDDDNEESDIQFLM